MDCLDEIEWKAVEAIEWSGDGVSRQIEEGQTGRISDRTWPSLEPRARDWCPVRSRWSRSDASDGRTNPQVETGAGIDRGSDAYGLFSGILRLTLMPDGQHHGAVPVQKIEHEIATVAKRDGSSSEFRVHPVC